MSASLDPPLVRQPLMASCSSVAIPAATTLNQTGTLLNDWSIGRAPGGSARCDCERKFPPDGRSRPQEVG